MAELTPGPAIDCELSCGVSLVAADYKGDDCPLCDEPAMAITLVECPAPDYATCHDENHDYGTGMHHAPRLAR